MSSNFEKMRAGEWYSCLDEELETLRMEARHAVHAHNALSADDRRSLSAPLRSLFGSYGKDCLIEAPFHCSYGLNIHLGNAVYLNAGCTILDSAPVRIGDHTMIGPGARLLCAEHHKDVLQRRAGVEIATPITLGADVWLGAGATVMPGVTVGHGAIIGAGAVVTHDVASGATVVGVPARPV